MDITEKRIKILMTVMVSIIALMIIAFVAKDMYDNSRSNDNKELTTKELEKINNKYKKKTGILISINSKKSFTIRDYETDEEYVFSSEEDIDIRNEYSKTIAPEELLIGDIVEAKYNK